MTEDQTRYKNLIRAGREKWEAEGNNADIEPIFQELEAKLNDLEFWQHTTEGLAVFASTDGITMFHLPLECEEHVCVGESYDIAPLLVLLAYDQPHYVLALAEHDTKLLRGDMYGLELIDIDFPTSPEEALNIDEMFANSQTVRNQDGASGAHMSTSSHGPGDSNQAGSEERLQYFRIIDGMICSSDKVDSKLPVLLAAPDNDAGDYKTLSRLPALLDNFLPGNYTGTPLNDLHAQSWPLVLREVGGKQQAALLERFNELRGAGKSSLDLQEITEAAEAGRVDTLLLSIIRMTTDSITDTIAEMPIITFDTDDQQEELQALTHAVFSQGGTVVGLTADDMPEQANVAAIFRY